MDITSAEDAKQIALIIIEFFDGDIEDALFAARRNGSSIQVQRAIEALR